MITTFGEIMLRISPSSLSQRVTQATDFIIEPGGSESNVAIALCNLGASATFITKLPGNPLGEKVIAFLRQFGVDTGSIRLEGDRIGLYFTENGVGLRNSFVIYDRENSAFCRAAKAEYDWSHLLDGSSWFHFSGISPAVSEEVYDVLLDCTGGIGIPYSIDLNYRDSLWRWAKAKGQAVAPLMARLCERATLIAGNESDFQNSLGMAPSGADETAQFGDIARQCFQRFPGLKYVSISNRRSISASKNEWSGFLFVREEPIKAVKGRDFLVENIQDRVGTGDSFIAGILFGLVCRPEWSYEETLDFAIALSALNHTIRGDASRFSENDVLQMLKTNGSGRILR